MLKKFGEGVVFGFGFAIALLLVWTIANFVVIPRLYTSLTSETKQPEFKSPKEAKVVEPDPKTVLEEREFKFLKRSGARMIVPPGGGILSMRALKTARGSQRPNTYQLWLTESKLWQIRTVEEKVEIEELPYPKEASGDALVEVMYEQIGVKYGHSSTTMSSDDIANLRRGVSSWRDQGFNGKLKMTKEGAVFVLPNPYDS
jgi:hypothetical protein